MVAQRQVRVAHASGVLVVASCDDELPSPKS